MGYSLSTVLWQLSYRAAVRSAFATVPFYREHWALDGRTAPVLVPGRTGRHGGAVDAATVLARRADLVPLAGGEAVVDPLRGLGAVLRRVEPLRTGTLVAVFGADTAPVDLPRGVRGWAVRPDDDVDAVLAQARGPVVAVGPDKQLQLLPDLPHLRRVPLRELDELDRGPHGLLVHPVLGVLAGLADCGRWHVDRTALYLRGTDAGLAGTVLRQRSPRLVDTLLGDERVRLSACPRHRGPVLTPGPAR